MDLITLTMLVVLVVSSERLILWRSEIFGGISNEISVLLDESTLPRDMKGITFGRDSQLCWFQNFVLQQKATWQRERRIPRRWCVWETQRTTGQTKKKSWGWGCRRRSEKMVCSKRSNFCDVWQPRLTYWADRALR